MNTRRAFTLVEIMVVVLVIGVLLALGVAAYLPQLRRSNAVKKLANVRAAHGAVEQYFASPTTGSVLPLTEPAAAVPYTGSEPDRAALATLDLVLFSTGFLTQKLDWRHSTPNWSDAQLGIRYDPATRTFIDSTPFDSTLLSKPVPPHFEARTSQPGTFPSLAAGANFRLNGHEDLPTNAVVIYAVLPNTSARDAHALAQELLSDAQLPVEGAACDMGKIAYPAADASGNTTVYLYVSHR